MTMRPRIIGILALLVVFSAASPRTALPQAAQARLSVPQAHATSTPAEKLPEGIALPVYKPVTIPFHPGERLQYQATWVGIPAATADVQISRDKKDTSIFLAQVSVKTNPAVDLLFKMRDSLVERVHIENLTPERMYIRQSENKRLNDFSVTFDRQAGRVIMVKSNRRGKQVREFVSPQPWGPLSGSIMALSQPLAIGERYVFDVFTGTTRYVLAFKVARREQITTRMGTFDTLRLVPSVIYDSGGKLKNSATATSIWVTNDQRHLPVRAEAQAFVGWVRADLVQIDG